MSHPLSSCPHQTHNKTNNKIGLMCLPNTGSRLTLTPQSALSHPLSVQPKKQTNMYIVSKIGLNTLLTLFMRSLSLCPHPPKNRVEHFVRVCSLAIWETAFFASVKKMNFIFTSLFPFRNSFTTYCFVLFPLISRFQVSTISDSWLLSTRFTTFSTPIGRN